MNGDAITLDEFVSFNFAILVYFLGVRLNKKIPFLRHYNIPEPVSGGLLVATLALIAYTVFDKEIGFSLASRDYLLFCFFTAIGLNAKFSDLAKGGKPLLLLLCLTVGYMILQNLVGSGIAVAMGLPVGFGLLGGTISLVGGHGTAIAWGPKLVETYGVVGAVEIGAATATLGLIAASLLGGPVGNYLIERKGGRPDPDRPEEAPMIGIESDREIDTSVTHTGLMRSLLVLNIAIALGVGLQEALVTGIGLDLPVFVTCLFCGIMLSNSVPLILQGDQMAGALTVIGRHIGSCAGDLPDHVIDEPAALDYRRTGRSNDDHSCNAALPLLPPPPPPSSPPPPPPPPSSPSSPLPPPSSLCPLAYIIFVLYPVMGRDYNAAVLGSGFAGFALGATPTAIANMTAVTKKYGPATQAFLILPLVSAFFVDLANAVIILLFLGG